jgi:small conductance mechanosensitive channel
MNLRTLFLRATTGELYIIPNGEVRIIRNFSRGSFSTTTVKIHVPTQALDETILILETLAHEALVYLPNVLEPWRILSTSEGVAHHTELTLFVKLRYGKAAEARPRLLKFIQLRLTEAEIELVD